VTDKQIQPSFDIMSELKIKRAKITESESASKVVNLAGDTERQEIIPQFVNRQLQVLVGIKCLDEGIDIPNTRIAILMASSTNPREYVQRVGRVIRQAPNKEPSVIYDFIVVPGGNEGIDLLEKEARRANHIAQNAINFNDVKEKFRKNGVALDAD
jgi:superfamily II DNA or RNA helicase